MHTFPHSRFAASHFAKFLKFCRYLTIKKKSSCLNVVRIVLNCKGPGAELSLRGL
jgi:hypothetical protein